MESISMSCAALKSPLGPFTTTDKLPIVKSVITNVAVSTLKKQSDYQLNRLKEFIFEICETKTAFLFKEKMPSIDLDFAKSREQIMIDLLCSLLHVSERELDSIDRSLQEDLMQFSIINIREIVLKTKYCKLLIDTEIIPKKLFREKPFEIQNFILHLTLSNNEWALFTAFCADASSERVIPIIETVYDSITDDAKFLSQLKRVAKILGKRYELKGFESKLLEWIHLVDF